MIYRCPVCWNKITAGGERKLTPCVQRLTAHLQRRHPEVEDAELTANAVVMNARKPR